MLNQQQIEAIIGTLYLALYCAAVEWFFYGIYVVLFFFCVKTLRKCRVPNRRALSLAVGVIFLFCTVHFALQLANSVFSMSFSLLKAAGHDKDHRMKYYLKQWNVSNIVMGVLYVTNNLIADAIFIYRCYGIWGRRKRIIAVPIVLLVATGCLGYASIIACGMEGFAEFLFITWLFPLEVVFSVMTNVLLMGLTAGRIWWITRGARALVGPEVAKRYRSVVVMILESGALYVIPGILYLILLPVKMASTQVIYSALAQIVGIAPTIIVVRVGLGKRVNDMESFAPRSPIVIDIRPNDLEQGHEKEEQEDIDVKEEIV